MPKGTDGMSALELSILTADERAALEEDSTAEELTAQKTPESADNVTVDDDETVTTGKPEGATDVIETPKPGASATVEDPQADDPEPFIAKMPVPQGEAVDYDAKIAELAQKFEDGDVSTAEYNAELTSLIANKVKAESAAELNASVETQLWERQKADFFDNNEQYRKSAVLFGALGAAISQLERDAAEGKGARLSGTKLLQEAHRNVLTEFGQVPPAARTAPATPKTSRAGTAPDLKGIPQTLVDVPVADAAETGKDRFAELDRLSDTDPAEWERRIAAMSPADQAAYGALQ